MNILPLNNNKNTNFGLRIKGIENSKNLIAYWEKSGFSQSSIQKAMSIIEEHANTTSILDFLRSIINPGHIPKERLKIYPAIEDYKITRVFMKDYAEAAKIMSATGEVGEKTYTVNLDTIMPTITYQFKKNGLPMPLNKKFSTPLLHYVKTITGDVLEPKKPVDVAKDIIKTFKMFLKEQPTPHRFIRPNSSDLWEKSVATQKFSS